MDRRHVLRVSSKRGMDTSTTRSAGEECPRAFGVTDGGGKSDAARIHARHAREAFDEAEGLPAAIAAQQ